MSDPMRCDEFVELVTAYVEGSLDAETERRVEANLAECDGCSTYLDQVRSTIAALGEAPAQTLPEEARQTLLRAFRRS